MDPFDPLGIKELPAQAEALYAAIDGLFTNPSTLYAQPGWLDYAFGNATGLFKWLAGIFLLTAFLFVIVLVGHGVHFLPRALLGSLLVSVTATLVWNFTAQWGPSAMQDLMNNVVSKQPPPPHTPVDSSQIQILNDYTVPIQMGKWLTGVLYFVPYLAWLSMIGVVAGVGMLALGMWGARWLRVSLYGLVAGTLSLPLMYAAYSLAKEKGNVNGVPISGFGMFMIVVAMLIPFLILFTGGAVEVIVKRRSKTQSEVSGDVDAEVTNKVEVVSNESQFHDPHTSVNLSQYYESRSAHLETEPQAPPPQPTSSKLDKALDTAAAVGVATGHIEVAAGVETVKTVKQNLDGNKGGDRR